MSATVLIPTKDNPSSSQNMKADPPILSNNTNPNLNNATASNNTKRYKKKMGFNTDTSQEG